MSKQEFQGKTLDEALSAAAKALGTEVTRLSYNILPQASGGLFAKLFQKGVRLEAWVDSTQDVQAAAREAVRQAMTGAQDTSRPTPRAPGFNEKSKNSRNARPQEQKQPTPRSNTETRGDRPARNAQRGEGRPRREDPKPRPADSLHDDSAERANRPRLPLNSEQSLALLKELAVNFTRGFEPEAVPSPQIEFIKEDEVMVSVSSPVLEDLLVKSDRLSCAYEHLFKRIAQKRFADISGRVVLNAGSASQRREEKLREMALDAASRVLENGKTITLSSKSSQERRVIHLALENMEGIATKSVGMGENRKLIVFSTLRPSREPREQNRRHRDGNTHSDGGQRAASSESGQPPRRSRRRGRHGGPRHNRRNETSGTALQDSAQSQKDHDSFEPHQTPEV